IISPGGDASRTPSKLSPNRARASGLHASIANLSIVLITRVGRFSYRSSSITQTGRPFAKSQEESGHRKITVLPSRAYPSTTAFDRPLLPGLPRTSTRANSAPHHGHRVSRKGLLSPEFRS